MFELNSSFLASFHGFGLVLLINEGLRIESTTDFKLNSTGQCESEKSSQKSFTAKLEIYLIRELMTEHNQ